MTGAEILALVPVIIGAMIGLWVCRLPDHQPNGLARVPAKAEPKPAAVLASVREELDDTPAYWDTRFHQLLEGLGAPVVLGETWEYRTWSNAVAYEYAERGYLDCPCTNCRRICHA